MVNPFSGPPVAAPLAALCPARSPPSKSSFIPDHAQDALEGLVSNGICLTETLIRSLQPRSTASRISVKADAYEYVFRPSMERGVLRQCGEKKSFVLHPTLKQ